MTTHRIWDGTACFTTHVVRGHTSIFTVPAYMDAICGSLEFCRKRSGLRIYGYVIMPDHLHLLTNVQTPDRLGDIMTAFRRFTATRLFEMLELDRREWALSCLRTGPETALLWEGPYRPIDASREDIFDQKLDYIHMNPVRTGFVRQPENWKYSSAAAYYLKEPGPLAIDRIEEQ